MASEQLKGREATQKRSPLDLIMNQFRRRTSFTERKKPSMGRLFRPSESNDKKSEGIPEAKEPEISEEKDSVRLAAESSDDSEISSVVGWGRVKQFVQKLGKTPDSQSLSLSHCDLTATDAVELGTLLPFLTQLEVMDLSWNDLLGGSLKALSVHMQHVSKLKVLKLSGCRLTAQDLGALGETLHYVPLLEMLDLSWNAGIGGGNLHLLTEHLHSTSSLRELHLLDCQLSETDSVALAEALLLLPCLELLDLSNNKLLWRALENISSSLSSTPQLKTLKMSKCGLNQESLAILGEKMKFLVGLEHLDVSCNKECGGGFGAMASSLSFLTHLKCLDLHMCCLTEEDAQTLVQVVPALSELSELDLSCNKSIGAAVQSLFPVLPRSKMKRLHLSNCSLSPEACHALAAVMPSLSQLQSLSLSWNKSVGENLQQFVERLHVECKLEELKLSSCDLNTDDLLHLQSACKRGALSNLKLLDVSYNGRVGDAGWVSLFREAGGLKQLQELDVSLRPDACLSASAWTAAMTDALPQLSSLRRVSMQRWTLGSEERQKLEKSLKKRNVVLESDEVSVQNVAG
ncbi:leucine-rich repeat-containing protein 31 isoform X2 [Pangasianodon hypophthalmus]|uniref:leucine-rich repeat-containing protein 31 isoform X2 n=1 Tax=Pangasianodon hypophthalmus TaxID=310915 RepID=UPI00147C6B3B|nr:leucine-rich repeat-containing protein 31 isoform X2 [Pangasianodon hypophthalmus]XP_053084139.1 leucine-rich repeat-containing protein 31 isoform X2 [Pangasianodon hypophthalmus]XP_053084140.1 leucine-rich repeat-containing protein 31 isoform X2 [Pangasianodon hypophthalmus]